MTTLIVSDLHLGLTSRRDLLRRKSALGALTAAIEQADALVLLGDLVELRERPVHQVLDEARPVLEQIGHAARGKRITIVPGNHDHHLATPVIDGARTLEPETFADPPRSGPLAEIAALGEVRLAYPGVWVRHDVYATHGHYLDVHNTVPSFERLAIGGVRRFAGSSARTGPLTPHDYEAAVAPVYALSYAMAQAARDRPSIGGSSLSLRVRRVANGERGGRLSTLLLGRVALPAAVGALNRAGFGPLKADLSAIELRRAALRGMREVIRRLGIDAEHVIFGHTHRSGPHPGDDVNEWGPLINTGSWIHEPAFIGDRGRTSPYWPGHVVEVPASGAPRLRALLEQLPT